MRMPTEPAASPASPESPGAYLYCRPCGSKVRAVGWRPGMPARCRKCGGELLPAGDATVTLQAADPLVGQTLGGVRIESRIGAGGMGSVYKGSHLALDKTVALKILPPEMMRQKTALERFQREARAAARLEHPNIVQVLNVGHDGGCHFIVMQYIPGESLARMVQRRGAIPWREALALVRDAARGLERAHQQGVIHRDIKPDNILVPPDGPAKVADFGLARTLDSNLSLSQTGQIMGTPDYMSPEQAQGMKTDGRSDIYSLGATFYFLLTARRPFTAETPIAVIMKHVGQPPEPVREVNPGVPESVANIVHKMLAKNPEDRFAGCGPLIAALNEAESGGTPVLATDLPRSRPVDAGSSGPSQIVLEAGTSSVSAFFLAGAGVAAVVLLAVIVIAMVRARNAPAPAQKPPPGHAGNPPPAPPAAADLTQLAGDLEAALSLRRWADAGTLATTLASLRDDPSWQVHAARLSPSLASLREHQARVAAGRVVDLAGGGDRSVWEFDDPAELEDFDRSIIPTFSARLDRGKAIGSGTLTPKGLSFSDGRIRLLIHVREIERPFRKDDKKGERPGPGVFRGGIDGPPGFALLLRAQDSRECYAAYLEPGEGDGARVTIAYIPPYKDDPNPAVLQSIAITPPDKADLDLSFSCIGDRLTLIVNGTVLLEATDTRLTASGRTAVFARGVKASIERLEVEALR